jgi:hypothetical protein
LPGRRPGAGWHRTIAGLSPVSIAGSSLPDGAGIYVRPGVADLP